MRNKIIIPLFLFFSTYLSSCVNSGEDIDLTETTILIYCAADNNLSNNASLNINTIIESVDDNLVGNKLFIYLDSEGVNPKLFRVYRSKGRTSIETVRNYEEHNSASPEVLSYVINQVFTSKSDRNGLILWSHGTSWLPSDKNNLTRSFGRDGDNEMEINELKDALPDNLFDFIIFDACLMNSIEVCYELKDKCKYILGSPNEIFAEGFPYHLIMGDLFSNDTLNNIMISMARSYFEYYSSQKKYYNSASISLIKTDGLDEFASFCKNLVQAKKIDINSIDLEDVQCLHYLDSDSKLFFDLEDYFSRFMSSKEQNNFTYLLDNIIIYKQCTSVIYSSSFKTHLIKVNKYSGLSTYVPTEKLFFLNNWYLSLSWGKLMYSQ